MLTRLLAPTTRRPFKHCVRKRHPVKNMASSSRVTVDSSVSFDIVQHRPLPSYSFPKRSFGKKTTVYRTCQAAWFQSWSWLHYDEGEDVVFCYVCMRAFKENKMSSGSGEPAFVSPSD